MPSLHPSPRRPPSVAAARARSIRRVTVVVTAVLVLFLWFSLSPASDPGDGDVSKADRVREALRNRLPIVPHVGGSKSILRKPSDNQGEGSWTCDRCLVDQPLCDLYGTRNIDLSRAFDGTGGRVRRVLKKALAGDHIKTAVLGGSISQGHGCECTVWHEQVSEWFKKTFPGASHEHTDGSVGARGSDYFKFCHKEHIDTDVDLVLIEMSVNDFRMGDAAFEDFETLLRAVLSYPSNPAVIILQTFKIDGIIATGGDSQLSLAQYYDVPVISARNWLLPMLMKDEKKIPAFFNYYVYTWDTHELIQGQRDLVHPNANGHKSLADMVNLYLDQQLCYLRNKRPEVAPSALPHIPQAADHYITSLPRMRLNRNFETDVFEGKYDPSCQSLDSRNGKLNVIEAETKGFELWTMPNSNGEKIFWRGTKAGDVITFELELATGEINAYYLKSSKWNNGNVECWLDNNKDKKGERLMGWWDNTQSVGSYQRIFSDPSIKPGTHKLHCEIIDWTDNPDKTAHSFYFIGLFSV